MRKLFLFLIMVLVPSLLMAQAAGGTIARPTKQQKKTRTSQNKQLSETQKAIIDNILGNMIHVAGGTYIMGATPEQTSCASEDEYPAHQVEIESFSICKYEVTQEEWEAIMGKNPSRKNKGKKYPVENVSWDDCQRFIKKLNLMTNMDFRLPTEAEWEFAARGGNYSKGYKYSGSNNVNEVAWYNGNSNMTTHEVGTKLCNEIGIHDMSGNVFEWCSDWFGSYTSTPQNNPVGPSKPKAGAARIARGGSVYTDSIDCRNTSRGKSGYDNFYANGFRLVL